MAEVRGTVLHQGPTEHLCGPGWVWHEASPADAFLPLPAGWYWRDPYDVAVGTVIECDCGKTWVCYRDPGYITRKTVWMPSNQWRLETKRERRQRERHARRLRG